MKIARDEKYKGKPTNQPTKRKNPKQKTKTKASITERRGGGNYATRFDVKEKMNSTNDQKWPPII